MTPRRRTDSKTKTPACSTRRRTREEEEEGEAEGADSRLGGREQQQAKKRREEEAQGDDEDKRHAEEFEDLCRRQAEKDQSRSEEDEEDEEEQATKTRRIEHLELELAVVMAQLGTSAADVVEAFVPTRTAKETWRFGLRAGMALDLTAHDSSGHPWDFPNSDYRNRARQLLKEQDPILLIGIPMCRSYLKLINLGRAKGNQDKRMRLAIVAQVQLHLCV